MKFIEVYVLLCEWLVIGYNGMKIVNKSLYGIVLALNLRFLIFKLNHSWKLTWIVQQNVIFSLMFNVSYNYIYTFYG